MNSETKLPVEIEKLTPEVGAMIYLAETGLTPYFEHIKAQVANEVPDLITDKGRKRVASLAAQVSRSKTAVEKVGRSYLKELKAQPKIVETNLREFVRDCDQLRDEVRQPYTDWELEQAAHKAMLESKVSYFSEEISAAFENITSINPSERLEKWQAILASISEIVIDESFEELKNSAITARDDALKVAISQVDKCKFDIEQQRIQQELAAKAQVEREDRIAKEAATKAKLEAEIRAKAEIERAEREVLAAKERAETIERQRIQEVKAAEQRRISEEKAAKQREELAAQQERQRIEREQELKRLEVERVAADKEHRRNLNIEALTALTDLCGLSETQAKQVIKLAANKKLGALRMNY